MHYIILYTFILGIFVCAHTISRLVQRVRRMRGGEKALFYTVAAFYHCTFHVARDGKMYWMQDERHLVKWRHTAKELFSMWLK